MALNSNKNVSPMYDHILSKYKEKPVVTANRQSHKYFSPVSINRYDDTRAEKISLLAMEMATVIEHLNI